MAPTLHPNWIAALTAEQRAAHDADPALAAQYAEAVLRLLSEQKVTGVCWSGMTTRQEINGPAVFSAILYHNDLAQRRAAAARQEAA